MATSLDSDQSRGADFNESPDGYSLFAGIGPDLYRENAFRITGLRPGVSARQIAKKIADLGVSADLGDLSNALPKAFGVKPPPTIEAIRAAERRLRDPETRFIDELFWFWPLDPADGGNDPALAAIAAGNTAVSERLWRSVETSSTFGSAATHNLAVRWHMTALDLENELDLSASQPKNRETLGKCWRSCLKRWTRLIADDHFWVRVTELVRRLDDPRIPVNQITLFRAALPNAIALINVRLAIRYAEVGDRGDRVHFHTSLYLDSDCTPVSADRFREFVIAELRNKFATRIEIATRQIQADATRANEIATDLVGYAKRYVELVDLVTVPEKAVQNTCIDDLVDVTAAATVAYQKTTSDNDTAAALLRQCALLARGESTRERIANYLQIVLSNLAWKKAEPIYRRTDEIHRSSKSPREKLKAFRAEIELKAEALATEIASTPKVRADLNNYLGNFLRALAVEAWNSKKDAQAAEEARLLGVHFAEDPALIAELKGDGHTLARLVKERKNVRNKGILGWGIGIGACIVIFSLNRNQESVPTPAPQAAIANTSEAPAFSPPTDSVSPPDDSSATPPNQFPADSTVGNQTYRVPDKYLPELNADEAAIRARRVTEHARARKLQALAGEIDRERSSVANIAMQLESLKSELSLTGTDVDQSDSVAVEIYNRDVSEYNAKLKRGRDAEADLKRLVHRYNGLLEQDQRDMKETNSLVDQYNEQLQRLGSPE